MFTFILQKINPIKIFTKRKMENCLELPYLKMYRMLLTPYCKCNLLALMLVASQPPVKTPGFMQGKEPVSENKQLEVTFRPSPCIGGEK